jgi:hypothetical protein
VIPVKLDISSIAIQHHLVFSTVFNTMLSQNNPAIKDNIWRKDIHHYQIQMGDGEGIGVGNTRNFFQTMADELATLCEKVLFVPAEEGAIRMVVNPDITIQLLRQHNIRVSDSSDIEYLFTFVGEFLALCVRYDIPINIKLSHAILAQMLYKKSEIDPDEYTLYYMLDMPNTSRPELNLITVINGQDNAEMIGDIGLSFNQRFQLVPTAKDEDLTIENYRQYLALTGEHFLTRRMLPGKLVVNTHNWLQALIDGFYIRNKLRTLNTTVPQLDKLMSGVAISEDKLREWVTADLITMAGTRNTHTEHMFEWLKEIILDMGKSFPYAEIGVDAPQSAEERNTMFLGFIGKLFAFWTGVRRLDMVRPHQVVFIEHTGLPKSATCFYQLKIPSDIPSKKQLYKLLVQAVYGTDGIMDLQGGKKRSAVRRHSKSKKK